MRRLDCTNNNIPPSRRCRSTSFAGVPDAGSALCVFSTLDCLSRYRSEIIKSLENVKLSFDLSMLMMGQSTFKVMPTRVAHTALMQDALQKLAINHKKEGTGTKFICWYYFPCYIDNSLTCLIDYCLCCNLQYIDRRNFQSFEGSINPRRWCLLVFSHCTVAPGRENNGRVPCCFLQQHIKSQVIMFSFPCESHNYFLKALT